MTDIDFPSHIVHLDVLNDMVKNYQLIYLTKSDIERILPFVRKSQEVETLLSNFVLEHYNSIDKNERSLSGTIIDRFRPLRGFLNVTLMGESDQIDNLNKSIKLLHDHIVYTIETYDSTGISLPHPKPIVNKSASVVNKPKKVVKEEKKVPDQKEKLDWLEDWQKLKIKEFVIFFSQALGVGLNPELIDQKQLANLVAMWTKNNPDSVRTKINAMNFEENNASKGDDKFVGFSNKTKNDALNVYYYIMRIAKYYSTITPQMHKILDNIEVVYHLNIDSITKKKLFDAIDNERKTGIKPPSNS